MTKEYNRANGDLFEKAVIIYNNICLGFDTFFDAAGGQTDWLPCQADIESEEGFRAHFEELVLEALASTRAVYGDIDADLRAIEDLAIAATDDPLIPKGELWSQCGMHTMSGIGDVDLGNGMTAEIKFVSAGNGTYHQTSTSYLSKHLGLTAYTGSGSYLEANGYYEELQSIFDQYGLGTVNISAASPVSREKASWISYEHPDAVRQIRQLEIDYRYGYLSYVREVMAEHPELLTKFYNDMLAKVKVSSRSSDPHVADFLVVANHKTGQTSVYELQDLIAQSLADNTEYDCDVVMYDDAETNSAESDTASFNLGAIIVTMSWKNHVGLNNPALYVFLNI